MKKLSFVIAMALLTSISSWAESVYIDDILYSLSFTTCNLMNGTKKSGDVVIPEKVTYNGKEYVVEGIWDEAFRDNVKITSFTVQGNSLTTIGEYAFSKCTSLKKVNLPQSVRRIEKRAFEQCGLESFDMPPITYLEEGLLYYCTDLKSVTLSPTIKTLPANTVYGCHSLTQLIIPEGIEALATSSINYCNSLTTVQFPNTLTTIGDNVMYNCFALEHINLPSSLRTIGENFMRENYLKSLIIPEGLTTLGAYSFSENKAMESLSLPNSLRNIGTGAFYRFNVLKMLYVNADTRLSSWSYMFSGADIFTIQLYVPAHLINSYKEEDNNFWYRFRHMYAIVPCDVNGDEICDISDVNTCIDMVIGIGAHAYDYSADVNHDTIIDISDINAITNKLLGK
ncbi:MAG: leucine-rich repeat protein [Bacteroidales bacterium]|nr:leucine-rich repeat protein [Candidatus Sodaliphilus limicaballi]